MNIQFLDAFFLSLSLIVLCSIFFWLAIQQGKTSDAHPCQPNEQNRKTKVATALLIDRKEIPNCEQAEALKAETIEFFWLNYQGQEFTLSRCGRKKLRYLQPGSKVHLEFTKKRILGRWYWTPAKISSDKALSLDLSIGT
ncbi:hypothetical protein ACFLZY_01015 [Patescibacteria group bacterium]